MFSDSKILLPTDEKSNCEIFSIMKMVGESESYCVQLLITGDVYNNIINSDVEKTTCAFNYFSKPDNELRILTNTISNTALYTKLKAIAIELWMSESQMYIIHNKKLTVKDHLFQSSFIDIEVSDVQ